MELRQVTAKIKPLHTHVLQDYLKLQIQSLVNCKDWKVLLIQELNKNTEKLSYKEALKMISLKGIDDYSINDMDITLLSNLLKNGNFKCTSYKCRCHLENLCEDRIFDAHSHGNESDMELFVWGTGALHNLKIFVESVYKNDDLYENEKIEYIKKYLKEINILLEEIKYHYDGNLEKLFMISELNNSISIILNSQNQSDMYWKVREIIIAEKNENKLDQFIFLSAERGIYLACVEIAYQYFTGYKKPINYEKAAKYYEKVYSSLSVNDKLNLASIYINQLSNEDKKEEGYQIIESLKQKLKNSKVYEYETKDGYTFYNIERIK